MKRRTALKLLAAAPWLSLSLRADENSSPAPRVKMGLVIHSFWVRSARPLAPDYPPLSDPLDFVAAAAKFGAAGIQIGIGVRDADYVQRLRNSLERHQMYLEGVAALPKTAADVARFNDELRTARSAGIDVVRTVCMNGRRYETYDSAEQFREFADQSWRALQLAEP